VVFVFEVIFLVYLSWIRPYMNKQANGFAISIAAINAFNMLLMIFFSDVFGLPGLANGILGVVWFVVNAVFALILLILVIVSCAYAFFSKDPEARYQPMRDDRSSFIRNAKESTTELDALAANVRGDGKEARDWSSEMGPRAGAQSPEEQYGRFRPMSQHSLGPFTTPSSLSFTSTAPINAGADPFAPPSSRQGGMSGTGTPPPRPVRGPREYEGYSSAYGAGLRTESPVPQAPGSSGGSDMWKRGIGFD
jgi:uncharacterized membrane protein